MAMAGIGTDAVDRYLETLRSNPRELNLLANDLLINVTGFFRDPDVFDYLAEKVVPDLVRGHSADEPIRIWIAGCSTGEETYSLAMLFHERIAAAEARRQAAGLRLRYRPRRDRQSPGGALSKNDRIGGLAGAACPLLFQGRSGYRVSPELRSSVVFAVQDVLADPPFSRLDLVSCRNLLIYLRPEAQTKVVSLFHFALREGGILLLGSAETVGTLDGRFELISEAARLYRHTARSRPGDTGISLVAGDGVRASARPEQSQPPSRQAALAELCQRLVMESYAPAAVLINRKHECLYSMGPTERYLRVAPGHPTHDLLSMARQEMRTRLRSAIQKAKQENARVVLAGGRTRQDGQAISCSIDVRPVLSDGEELLLICFADAPRHGQKRDATVTPRDVSRVAELEQELEATRLELQGAIRDLEISNQEQKAINEEALSINEEYQSTNEELLTSKEELQSLNEELTALNSQLQETLELQRTTSNDLQNVLYSTDVATIFLDTSLNIRFFTPATRSLFNVIPGDVGRPLADLTSLAADGALLTDARTVLRTFAPIEREIEAQERRLVQSAASLPYRTDDDGVEGVVITFADITERRHVAQALEAAKRQAELANIGEVALPRRRQPRPAPAAAGACPAAGVVGERGDGRGSAEAGHAVRRDVGHHCGYVEHAARHKPDRHRRRRC